ncbi:MAG TPA: hypothetical protein VKE88_02910, partial [Candidatus Nanoarchaeia archaeon]|nr:hypothetical protein [Candidatus Nanoarchaeia archaeon]
PTTYDLKLNGPQWLKLPTNTITLQPGEKAELVVNTATKEKDEQGDYEVELVATVKGEDIGFASTFIVKLRALTVTQTLVQYAIAYWIVLVAIAVLLVILLFIKIFGGRIARRYRSWKIRRQEAAKLAKELKARKAEEKKAAKLLKQSLKAQQPNRFWKRFWTIILVLFVVSGIAAGVFVSLGYAPFVSEYFKQKEQASQQFEPIIQVDTSDLEAYGNTVIVRGEEVVIPVVVKNNYDEDLVFSVEVNAPWIKTDVKSIELDGHDSETFNLRVTPDKAEKGLYKIGVSATLEKENKRFTEDITLNVRKKSLMQEFISYLPYLIGGLVALGLILFFGKKYKKAPKAEKKEEKITYKPVRKVSIDIPTRK